MIVLQASQNQPVIYVASYTRGDEMTERTHCLLRELWSVGLPWLQDEPLIGFSPAEANNLSAERFLQSPCQYFLHVDHDNVLPSGSLSKMIEADADVVTLHSCNRGSGWSSLSKLWEFPDNHVIFGSGHRYFAQAVILIKRRVFEILPRPWWRTNFLCDFCGSSVAGEVYFCHSVLECPDLTFKALDIVSPHLEIVIYRGASYDFSFVRSSDAPVGGHAIRRYEWKPHLS